MMNTMRKYIYHIYALSLLLMAYSCQSEENFAVQEPDEFEYIRFGVGVSQITRAGNDYEDYDPEKHPSTMGVLGFKNNISPLLFNNQIVSYDKGEWNYQVAPSTTDATTDGHVAWKGEASTSYDFFAYMPHVDDHEVSLANNGNAYTLSFPVSIPNGILTDTKQVPLIAKEAIHRGQDGMGEIVSFWFDQVLAGFRLNFKLGKKMDDVREFIIKEVHITGDNFRNSATVSRAYTLNGNTYKSGDITWTQGTAPDTDPSVSIHADPLKLTYENYQPWGSNFYVIPSYTSQVPFTPTIEVTYDITTNDPEQGVLTRKDVKNTIVLNTTNFPNYSGIPVMAKIYPININIVPRYLYVLADQDQHSGVLIIDLID